MNTKKSKLLEQLKVNLRDDQFAYEWLVESLILSLDEKNLIQFYDGLELAYEARENQDNTLINSFSEIFIMVHKMIPAQKTQLIWWENKQYELNGVSSLAYIEGGIENVEKLHGKLKDVLKKYE